tara:strand:+ start:2240 stop:3130 length:891 start_codon:yes stop_codon:yes gene_type:complete
MKTNALPPPDKALDWSHLLKDMWMHGMSVHNIEPHLAESHIDSARDSMIEVFTRRNEARTVRPSAFLACARQTYFSVKGEDSGKMPDNIGPTFAVGHLLHELSYAAVKSALPGGFSAHTEVPVHLPQWWPKQDKFNQKGHVDMLIIAEDRAACAPYLNEDQPKSMLIDFKTMGGFSYKKHGKTVWGEDPDAFGYLAQVAVYADALGQINDGAIIAGINRDSLVQPLAPRFIAPEALKDELARVKIALDMALEQNDPGEEFLVRHGKDAHFQCGRGGRPGYCPFKKVCKENPTRDGD